VGVLALIERHKEGVAKNLTQETLMSINTRWLQRAAFTLVLALGCCVKAQAQDAATLRAKHDSLAEQLASSPFKQPLVLESTQSSGDLKGEVYAVVEQPFSVVAPALQGMDHWCDLLILHLNVKNCTYTGKPPNEVLSLVVGRKFDQPLDDGYKVDFTFSTPAASDDYLRVQMSGDSGPVGTRDYRLALEAIPLNAKTSFLHMSYAYSYGVAARVALQAYLATAGRDKVGFSVVGKGDDGKAAYINGVRGVIERNTMRYYLAIEAYLGSVSAPPGEQLDKRLGDWFAATERYSLQLHEMERDEYLAMKRNEVARQRAPAAGAKPG
jgi:hypothetical protein